MERKLYKSKDDRKLSGVCAGIATYFGIDSTIISLLWVFGTFFTGFIGGIVLYIVCAVIVPDEPDYYDAEFKEKKI